MYHYDVAIVPDKCPRRVNREIVEALVQAHADYFGHQKPVFDGRKNLYSRRPLPIGRDRVSGVWEGGREMAHSLDRSLDRLMEVGELGYGMVVFVYHISLCRECWSGTYRELVFLIAGFPEYVICPPLV